MNSRDGGPPRALVGLAAAQHEAGLHVHVVSGLYPDAPPDLIDPLVQRGIPITHLGPVRRKSGYLHGMGRALRPLVRQADIVHIHCLWEWIQHAAASEARRCGKPYIFRPAGMLDPYSLRAGRWGKRAYLALFLRRDLNGAAAIHFTAEIERDKVSKMGLRAQTIVEPNGIELDDFRSLPAPGSFRQRYPQLGDKPIVLFLSRVHPKKGVDLLIDAFAVAETGNAVLVIAGPADAAYQQQLEQQIAQRGLTDRVLFTGMLHGLERIEAYVDADLFVLPSHQENFGIVVIEALASGVAVLISDQIDIWPSIRDHDVGRVFALQPLAIAAAIEAGLADVPWRQRTGEAARAYALKRFDWRQIAQRWAEHYQRLAGAAQT
ncbi:MAG: glycosyltransferase [Phycisphaeraceae bacterium]|nr:glycosyltransferase [Phycisphaeraceae bacterium]